MTQSSSLVACRSTTARGRATHSITLRVALIFLTTSGSRATVQTQLARSIALHLATPTPTACRAGVALELRLFECGHLIISLRHSRDDVIQRRCIRLHTFIDDWKAHGERILTLRPFGVGLLH